MPGQRVPPRFTGGFGGFLPPPDLPPLGDYEAPTIPSPSLTVYPGGGRQSSTYNTPRSPDNPRAGYESVSRTLFADDTFNPRTYSPGREPPLPTDSSPPDPVSITTPDPGPTVDVSGRGGGMPSPFWNQPGGGYAQPGQDIAGFGGNMTLGQFLSTPLAMMRFGNDRYQTPVTATSTVGGKPPDLLPGEAYIDPYQSATTDVVPSPDAPSSSLSDPASGVAEPSSPQASGHGGGGSAFTGSDGHSADYIGYGQSAMSLADLKVMESQAYGGNPNQVDTGDEGASRFYRAQHPSALIGAPPVLTNAASVDAYNAWVMSHGGSQPPNPNNLYVQATAGKSPVRPRPSTTPQK
jgi:hypothetical protein